MLFNLPGRRGRNAPTQANPSTQPWFRRLKSRLKSKLGTKAAVTAAAHKLARILWAMVKNRRPYNPSVSAFQSWRAPEKNAIFADRPSNSASR